MPAIEDVERRARRDAFIGFRATHDLRRGVGVAAARDGRSISDFICRALTREIARDTAGHLSGAPRGSDAGRAAASTEQRSGNKAKR